MLKEVYSKMRLILQGWRKEKSITWNVSVLILILGILFILFVVIFQHGYYSRPKKMDLSGVQIADDSYAFSIDSISAVSTQGDYYLIHGWAVHLGEDFGHFNTQLVLYGDSLEDTLVLKLSMISRTDITEYYDDGYNYDCCGFLSYVKSGLVNGKTYNIALLYNDTETDDGARLILTGETFTYKE